jgi:hypothetical protein
MIKDRKVRCRPDLTTFHLVLWGWAKIKTSNALENMKAVFQRMDQMGIEPDTVAHNNLIHLLSRMEEAERAEAVLRAMKHSRDKQIQPSPVSYLSVISGWLKQDLNRAHRIFLEFHEECMQGTYMPWERPYLVMSQAWDKAKKPGHAELIKRLWKQVQDSQPARANPANATSGGTPEGEDEAVAIETRV